ncbi:Smr/MutS family protein [Bdellovibrionota bacterium FG-1]
MRRPNITPNINKAAQSLEWGRFLEYAEPEARTDRAKAFLRQMTDPGHWAQSLATARLMQHETQECSPLLDRDALWGPLTDLSDPEVALERLARGSVLEIVELALIRKWLYAMDSWCQTPRDEIRGELFKKALSQLPDPFEPLRILDRILTPEGELSEKASPRLAQLYTEIRALKREVGVILDHLLKTFAQKGVLQENFSDVRDGRFVLPIKISSQSEVDGIIYEASASRQTVFIEPREVAGVNNRLKQKQNELIQEIFIVLSETSKKIQPFSAEIQAAVQIISHWDVVQAKARLGLHYSGKMIQVTESRTFLMQQTAHPLLFWSLNHDRIIRNEIDFGEPIRTLLLTGPNTGGKTVLLKTLGLAGICARTGFPFPGADHPTIPFFESFFADLGDPQSIEHHLSSFSGHIARFKEILENVTDRSLVLIDELNSATDPEEGAALGRAFLETVISRGALIVTTTHDPHLKASAVSDTRILNASMQFDESSRIPTFKMILGVPGRSRALETAERLGIPQEVLRLARTYLTREHLEFEAMLAKLESDSRETERARKDSVRLRDEAEKLKKEWTERTQAAVNEMLERTRQKLRRILEQAQDQVRTSVRKLDEAKHRKDLDQTRSAINEAFSLSNDRLETALDEEAPELAQALALQNKEIKKPTSSQSLLPLLHIGTQVRIPKWKTTGTVLEIQGAKAKVSMGTIQMVMSTSDIEPLAPSEVAALPKQRRSGSRAQVHVVAVPDSQVDLRGIRFDEAMSQLSSYLDQAYQSGALAEVTIVHGLGTGALREGTRKLLAELAYIKNYRDGGVGMGGSGATIVEFERD